MTPRPTHNDPANYDNQLTNFGAKPSRALPRVVNFPAVLFIRVPGEPVPKGRPRARIATTKAGKPYILFYTPKETENYETAVKWSAVSAMVGYTVIDEAVEAHVMVYMKPPMSWSKKMQGLALSGDIKHTVRPDADNYLKAAMDALNGIVFTDDARVWRKTVEKHYCENPRMEIFIKRTVPATLI